MRSIATRAATWWTVAGAVAVGLVVLWLIGFAVVFDPFRRVTAEGPTPPGGEATRYDWPAPRGHAAAWCGMRAGTIVGGHQPWREFTDARTWPYLIWRPICWGYDWRGR